MDIYNKKWEVLSLFLDEETEAQRREGTCWGSLANA